MQENTSYVRFDMPICIISCRKEQNRAFKHAQRNFRKASLAHSSVFLARHANLRPQSHIPAFFFQAKVRFKRKFNQIAARIGQETSKVRSSCL